MSDFSEDEMKYSFEKAVWSDLGFCLRAIDEGRDFQREQGFVQWADNYPDRSLIEEDIRTGIGHILCINGSICRGYIPEIMYCYAPESHQFCIGIRT